MKDLDQWLTKPELLAALGLSAAGLRQRLANRPDVALVPATNEEIHYLRQQGRTGLRLFPKAALPSLQGDKRHTRLVSGAALRAAREQTAYSQGAASKALGLHRTYVGIYERKGAGRAVVERLAALYGTTVEHIQQLDK